MTLAVRRLARTAIPAPVLLIVAGMLDGTAQALVWCLALAIDFGVPSCSASPDTRCRPGTSPSATA